MQRKESSSVSFLKHFTDKYRNPSKLVEAIPSLSKSVRQVHELEKIPPIPDGYTALDDSRLIKWYSMENSRLIAYFDDGFPLPDVSDLHIVWQTTAEVTEEGSTVRVVTWVLRRD